MHLIVIFVLLGIFFCYGVIRVAWAIFSIIFNVAMLLGITGILAALAIAFIATHT